MIGKLLESLFVQVKVDADGVGAGLRSATKDVNKFGRDAQRSLGGASKQIAGSATASAGAMGKLGGAASLAGGILGGVLAMGAMSALSSIRDMARAAIDAGGALGEEALALGVTTDALQSFRYMATQVGLDQREMDTALKLFSQRLGEVAISGDEAGSIFGQLGVSIRNSQGEIRGTAELIPLLAEAMKSLGSEAERSAVLADLFGAKAGAKMATLMADGAAGVERLAAAAKSLGLIMSAEEIARLDAASDKMAEMDYVIEKMTARKFADHVDEVMAVESAWASVKLAAFDVAAFVIGGLKGAFTSIIGVIDAVNAKAFEMRDGFIAGAQSMARAMANMATAAQTWLTGKLSQALDGAKEKARSLVSTFAWMYDEVVGHSHVPDMVAGIAAEMAKLDAVMVAPAVKGAKKVVEAMKSMATETRALLSQLFPEVDELMGLRSNMALIDKSGLTPEIAQEARNRLLYGGMRNSGTLAGRGGETFGAMDVGELSRVTSDSIANVTDALFKMGEMADHTTPLLVDFSQGIGDTIMGSIHAALTGGDWKDVLKSGLNRVLSDVIGGALRQLETMAFGGGGLSGFISNVVGSFLQGRAVGGPTVPQGAYAVGNGELFVPGQHGRVLSRNDAMKAAGGGSQIVEVRIDKSRYFDAEVRQIADRSASGAVRYYDSQVGGRVRSDQKRRG